MIRKLMICPWFGALPPWFDQYLANIELLKPYGYDWLITTNLNLFKQRVGDLLGIKCPIEHGTGKVWDYRACLGVLFEEEVKHYDYFGHADFDCVFGRIDHFMPDMNLCRYDIWSNHADVAEPYGGYICGPWTLYRNGVVVCGLTTIDGPERIADLFRRHGSWREILERPEPTGWVEFQDGYTGIVDQAHKKHEVERIYTMHQTKDLNNFSTLQLDSDGTLYEGGVERMMAHFRRKKEWPLKESL